MPMLIYIMHTSSHYVGNYKEKRGYLSLVPRRLPSACASPSLEGFAHNAHVADPFLVQEQAEDQTQKQENHRVREPFERGTFIVRRVMAGAARGTLQE